MESKSGFVKAVISVVFGIVGTVTVHWLIGIPLAIIGMILGYASYDFTDGYDKNYMNMEDRK